MMSTDLRIAELEVYLSLQLTRAEKLKRLVRYANDQQLKTHLQKESDKLFAETKRLQEHLNDLFQGWPSALSDGWTRRPD